MATTLINRKCAGCGLVNFAAAPECGRCGAPLDLDAVAPGVPTALEAPRAPTEAPRSQTEARRVKTEAARVPPDALSGTDESLGPFGDEPAPRRLRTRVAWILSATCGVVFAWYASLLLTAGAPSMSQRLQVREAVGVVERGGFAREAFLLRRVSAFRTSDNWWNRAVGHGEAYAATNFPFEVVTLYPEFFKYPEDDTERAVVLLHEARHLSGADEHDAFASVWRDKARLGWTREKYAHTRVWKNVEEFTRRHAPELFTCGRDLAGDCVE